MAAFASTKSQSPEHQYQEPVLGAPDRIAFNGLNVTVCASADLDINWFPKEAGIDYESGTNEVCVYIPPEKSSGWCWSIGEIEVSIEFLLKVLEAALFDLA